MRMTKQYTSLLGEHSHILENLFNDILPLFTGPVTWSLLFTLDIRIFWIWMAFRQVRSIELGIAIRLTMASFKVTMADLWWSKTTSISPHVTRKKKQLRRI